MLSTTTCASQFATYLLKFVADHKAHSHKSSYGYTESTQSPSVDWLIDWLIDWSLEQRISLSSLKSLSLSELFGVLCLFNSKICVDEKHLNVVVVHTGVGWVFDFINNC
jgi:hypothetical protein